MLVFSADVNSKAASARVTRKAVVGIETTLIRPPVVVDDRLPEMVAIVYWCSADAHKVRVDGFNPNHAVLASGELIEFQLEFFLQLCVQLPRLAGNRITRIDRVASL